VPAAPLAVETSADGVKWEAVGSVTRPHQFFQLPEPKPCRFVRVTLAKATPQPAAVSGLRVFGLAAASPPPPVRATAVRTGPTAADVTWPEAGGATGYNVRYGLAPDRLYACWQTGPETHLTLRSLNAGVAYWAAVDAFNAAGVTPGEPVRLLNQGSLE
jgi:hypothetical protein